MDLFLGKSFYPGTKNSNNRVEVMETERVWEHMNHKLNFHITITQTIQYTTKHIEE